MSGTSMDGVDLAYCVFQRSSNGWNFQIEKAETIAYSSKWRIRLSQLRKQDAITYVRTDTFYGHYLGELVNDFIGRNNLTVDFISSHGHTVFHQPYGRITAQVGSGAALNAITGLPVVCDFRSGDVALGGQGAPLVPIGDRDLFGQYDFILNLGGFANISAYRNGKSFGFDVCPANIILNRIARNLDMAYDENGAVAQIGAINYDLLKRINNLEYYRLPAPKSLGREWINSVFWPITRNFPDVRQADFMKTFCDHIAYQISKAIDNIEGTDTHAGKKMLVTGGGAYNSTLIDLIRTHTDIEVVIPESETIINYKEALIFAYLGLKRVLNEPNCLADVTGASADIIGGALYGNFSRIL